MMDVRYRRLLVVAAGAALYAAPLAAQGRRGMPNAQAEAFFDTIPVPNWVGTDIAHTSIKTQIGGTCWDFATVSFLESEVLRTNEALRTALAAQRQELDLSEYYVAYWGWVDKALEYANRKGEGFHPRGSGVPLGDGGLSHDVVRIIREHGIVPESDYVQPQNSGQMTRDVLAAMAKHREANDWDADRMVADVRAVLDQYLKSPPTTITVDGKTMTPQQYASDVLNLKLDDYWEITSYESIPFWGRGEVDVPDNWWDYKGYYNVPLDTYIAIMNQALDNGYSVAIDTDWSDQGAQWNGAGFAVIHPSLVSGKVIDQDVRETEFKEGRTSDDHLVHAVDHRVLDGHDWYLIKNSHGVGSGRRGYVWIRDDWFALRVLGIMVNREAIPQDIVARFTN
jgi:bleomycin hydrolase